MKYAYLRTFKQQDLQIMKKLVLCIIMAAMCAPMFSQTRQERLTGHVYYFASDSLYGRAAGSEYAAKAAAYIVNEYESMGLKPFYDDWYMPFTTNGKDYKNVVAVLEGNDPELKDQYIVIGAHYDHLGVKKGQIYNGADDNASGSAAVIEIARALCANRDKLKRTVVIAAFDAEELGLYGSNALADRMLGEDGLDVRLMMSVDMVGWYRATLAISTGIKSPYHKPEDDADLIDYEGLDKVTDYLTDLTMEVASDENFAASGRVARKHRSGHPILEVALSPAIGSSHFNFPDAPFEGKTAFSYGGGVSAQLNFGHFSHFGIKADALYLQASAPYPDATAIYSSSLKYKGSELRVPVQLIYQGGGTGTAFLGFGGYYGHRFKTSLASPWTVRTEELGLSWEFGLKVGGTGLSVLWMSSLTPFFDEKSAPSVRQGTALVRLNKYF